ncbi:gas vesicle protein GvpJ [Streptomyces libani]|uniref:Gas vesicle protein A n=3 Tax=Streptomyces TaxID=1883 RepID=A0A3Q9K6U3_9ACTN|nr:MULTISPECIES: gas vesicle protein GvpJ [Streptomyces]MCW7985702.1 gas vesicle protein [Streptomyces platensis subsp. clarensis]AWN25506.1 gas vesicle protein [Streptomyces sp. NEAU-S7GS2]AZS70085.1 gas vesicle protein [Streptomyces lydicus]MCR8573831.1 gas vesicle structural protein GvpA [Streptomyces sp. Isolate_219]MCX5445472.1 gas vesicle structural protein GvpA [Streptomyces libani]
MTTTTYSGLSGEVIPCPPRAGTLYDVMELILDRGMVIDVFIRVSLVGIEILKIDARIVVASVDTYLRFAEACNRLDLERDSGSVTVPELFSGQAAKGIGKRKVKDAAKSVGETVRSAVGKGDDSDDDADEEEAQPQRRRRSSARSGAASRRRRSEEE